MGWTMNEYLSVDKPEKELIPLEELLQARIRRIGVVDPVASYISIDGLQRYSPGGETSAERYEREARRNKLLLDQPWEAKVADLERREFLGLTTEPSFDDRKYDAYDANLCKEYAQILSLDSDDGGASLQRIEQRVRSDRAIRYIDTLKVNDFLAKFGKSIVDIELSGRQDAVNTTEGEI